MRDENYFLEREPITGTGSQTDRNYGAGGRRMVARIYDTAYNAFGRVCDAIETPFGKAISTMALAFGLGLNVWIYSNIYETEKFLKEHNRSAIEESSPMPPRDSNALEGDFSKLLYIIEEPNKIQNPRTI